MGSPQNGRTAFANPQMKQLATMQKSRDLIVFTPEQVDLIKRNFAKNSTDDELKLFLHHAQKTGLDPIARQIYFQKRGDGITILTGIDGYRLIADRTGKYAGNDDPVFDNEESPRKATVTVYKIVDGVRCGYSSSARWDQYYPGDKQGFMWRKMPHLMLGKCAEALALRKAFPAELSGVYVKEEMDQAGEGKDIEYLLEDISPEEKPDVPFEGQPVKLNVTLPKRKASIYTGSEDQRKIVSDILRKRGVPEDMWEGVHQRLIGRPSTDLNSLILETQAFA